MCILDRKQTQIKHKQTDLRGSPKPGTSTEAADCILLEEWYKHSTQPNTTHWTQCFTLTLFSLKSTLALTLTVAFTCTHHCTLYAFSRLFSIFCLQSFTHVYRGKESINIVVVKERVVDGGEGSWEWLRKMLTIANVDNLLHLAQIWLQILDS